MLLCLFPYQEQKISMSVNISYKCKSCGSSMEYDAGTDSLVCSHCGNREKVTDLEKEQEWQKIRPQGDFSGQPEEDEGSAEDAGLGIGSEETLRLYSCPNCGAQLMADEYTAATVCAYCKSPVVLQERVNAEAAPKYVVPFKIGRKEAKEVFRKWTKSGFFTPRVFSSEAVLDTITGTYVPYWLYDCRVHMDMTAKATRVDTRRSGNKETIYTHHYHIEREIDMNFEHIPADASEKMPDEIMEKLEPFSYGELDEFRLPYLSGYMAECANGPAEAYSSHAFERAAQAAVIEGKNTIKGYSTVSVVKESHEIHDLVSTYAMMPVWVFNYRYRNKDWQLYLNGQTGKKIGKLPVDRLKAGLTFLAISGAFTALVATVMHFTM